MAGAVLDTMTAEERKEELVSFYNELEDCRKCDLCQTRTTVVFGSGDPDAEIMFVGEAPGFHEDQQGKPFVGRAGKLLDELLEEIGLTRKQVFIANVLKCRPPDNRDPESGEIDSCKEHLFKQIEIIRPLVICTLGNFSTKLLSGQPDGITKVHGKLKQCTVSDKTVYLYPIFHPAAALYTPKMRETLSEDFKRLPSVLKEVEGGTEKQSDTEESGETVDNSEPEAVAADASSEKSQMGLF